MQQNIINSYRDLKVWQKSVELATELYELTEAFPKSELYGLTSQIRRASVSIPANLAEGYRRGGNYYTQFVSFSYGSGAELETHLEIVKRLSWGKDLVPKALELKLEEIMKMLNVLLQKIKSP